jgi:hypothetical protein
MFIRVLQNPLLVRIGVLSFGIYMWHQPYLAFARYCVFESLGIPQLTVVAILIVITSISTYYFVETPFRSPHRTSARQALAFIGVLFVVSTGAAFHVYLLAGAIRDVPELEIEAGKTRRGLHSEYNHRIHEFDREFAEDGRINVLVLGNSFARDWGNVLLSSKFADQIDISYSDDQRSKSATLLRRAAQADVVFASTPDPDLPRHLNIDPQRFYALGTKNFGRSNGIFYNRKGVNYFKQRAHVDEEHLVANTIAKSQWGTHYMDYLGKVLDSRNTVPIFTPEEKFISQDCRHLTRFGAQYFARLFQPEFDLIFTSRRDGSDP